MHKTNLKSPVADILSFDFGQPRLGEKAGSSETKAWKQLHEPSCITAGGVFLGTHSEQQEPQALSSSGVG